MNFQLCIPQVKYVCRRVLTRQDDCHSCRTWRCTGINRRLDISGATLGGHGQCHLLLLVFSQGSLYCLSMDICTDREQYTLWVRESFVLVALDLFKNKETMKYTRKKKCSKFTQQHILPTTHSRGLLFNEGFLPLVFLVEWIQSFRFVWFLCTLAHVETAFFS